MPDHGSIWLRPRRIAMLLACLTSVSGGAALVWLFAPSLFDGLRASELLAMLGLLCLPLLAVWGLAGDLRRRHEAAQLMQMARAGEAGRESETGRGQKNRTASQPAVMPGAVAMSEMELLAAIASDETIELDVGGRGGAMANGGVVSGGVVSGAVANGVASGSSRDGAGAARDGSGGESSADASTAGEAGEAAADGDVREAWTGRGSGRPARRVLHEPAYSGEQARKRV